MSLFLLLNAVVEIVGNAEVRLVEHVQSSLQDRLKPRVLFRLFRPLYRLLESSQVQSRTFNPEKSRRILYNFNRVFYRLVPVVYYHLVLIQSKLSIFSQSLLIEFVNNLL